MRVRLRARARLAGGGEGEGADLLARAVGGVGVSRHGDFGDATCHGHEVGGDGDISRDLDLEDEVRVAGGGGGEDVDELGLARLRQLE